MEEQNQQDNNQNQQESQNKRLNNTQTQSSGSYASPLKRLVAIIIDFVLLVIVLGTLGAMVQQERLQQPELYQVVTSLISWVYFVGMTHVYGQTLGKMALRIKVQHLESKDNPTVVQAFLREVVGRFLASIVFFLGYIWILFDKNKQGWHDKIANTVVIDV